MADLASFSARGFIRPRISDSQPKPVISHFREGSRRNLKNLCGKGIMADKELLDGHDWSYRRVRLDGRETHHRHCKKCGRDFTSSDSKNWVAVYVGIFEFIPLEDGVNFRWLTEPCPKNRLAEDRNEVRRRGVSE